VVTTNKKGELGEKKIGGESWVEMESGKLAGGEKTLTVTDISEFSTRRGKPLGGGETWETEDAQKTGLDNTRGKRSERTLGREAGETEAAESIAEKGKE